MRQDPGRSHFRLDDAGVVLAGFGAAFGQEVQRIGALQAEQTVRGGGRGVARLSGIDHDHPATSAGQRQGGAQTSGTATNDRDLRVLIVVPLLAVPLDVPLVHRSLLVVDPLQHHPATDGMQFLLPNGKMGT
nr:hypothetical protein [Phytoactinopolyspora limicola]